MQDFLPVNKKEMKERGWDQVDFAYISGDAYVDHPSFGTAIISRLLESRGYKVGIISQPDWKKKESIQIFGELYKIANKREIMKIQDEFLRVFRTKDLQQLKRFHRQLDIISEGYRAQAVYHHV